MGNKETEERRDFHRKLEAWAKFLGGLGAMVGAVVIPWMLSAQAEKSRDTQLFAEIMSQREAKDSEIRAKMFETLLSSYLKRPSPAKEETKAEVLHNQELFDIKVLNEKLVSLDVLIQNFQEYFNARPLFEDLYKKITDEIASIPEDKIERCERMRERCKRNGRDSECADCKRHNTLKGLKQRLIKIARSAASKQVTMLSRVGLVSSKIPIKEKCSSSTFIPLFKIKERIRDRLKGEVFSAIGERDCDNEEERGQENNVRENRKEWWKEENILGKNSGDPRKEELYAISIKVEEIEDPAVEISVSLHKYAWEEGNLDFIPIKREPFVFSVSYFDMPYMDNTRLFEGKRFAIVLKKICSKEHIEEHNKGIVKRKDDCVKRQTKYKVSLDEKIEILKLGDKINELEEKIEGKDISNKEKTELKKEKGRLEDKKGDLKKRGKREKENEKISAYAVFQVITFDEKFMSLRDRPLFEDMLTKLKKK